METGYWLHCNPTLVWATTSCLFWFSTLVWLTLTGIKPTNISSSLKTPIAEVNFSIQVKDSNKINQQLNIPGKTYLPDN
jgi:hypothetical protein